MMPAPEFRFLLNGFPGCHGNRKLPGNTLSQQNLILFRKETTRGVFQERHGGDPLQGPPRPDLKAAMDNGKECR